MALYADQRADGLDLSGAMKIVRFLNIAAVARRVEQDVRAAGEDLSCIFMRARCYDCGHCDLRAAGGCVGIEAEREAYRKAAHAIARSQVSQEALLELLKPILHARVDSP